MPQITCSCGRSLRVEDSWAGKKVRCPACKSILTVPPSTVPPMPPPLTEVEEAIMTEEPAPTEAARPARPPLRMTAEDDEDDEDDRPRRRKRRGVDLSNEAISEGWIHKKRSGVVVGILMMVGAVVWF